MAEEKPRRKPRTPLTPEELQYFIKIKELKKIKKIEEFKATSFYKIFNYINITLAAFVTYFILSILILNKWEPTHILSYSVAMGDIAPENHQRTISEIQLRAMSGDECIIKTDYLFKAPEKNQSVYLGKDVLFDKIIKLKLNYDNRAFWSRNAYASLSVCAFALGISFFIYKINKHLSINGLLTVFGLFTLACLYFVLV